MFSKVIYKNFFLLAKKHVSVPSPFPLPPQQCWKEFIIKQNMVLRKGKTLGLELSILGRVKTLPIDLLSVHNEFFKFLLVV